MPTLTENRKKILRMMGEGKVIEQFAGFGTRMRPHAELVDPPYREPGKTEIKYGKTWEEIKYTDFKAFLHQFDYIEHYFTDWSRNFYRLNQKGKAAFQALDQPGGNK